MVRVAKIALSAATYAIDKPYDYRIPEELSRRAVPGVRVVVPFGAGNRRTEGIVLAVTDGTRFPQLKAVITVLDDAPVLSEGGIHLAVWMRERFFCTVYTAARAMLPAGLWYSLKDSYRLVSSVDRETAYAAAGQSAQAARVLDLVYASNGSAQMEQIRGAFGAADPNPALRRLTERGILTLDTSASRKIGDKWEQMVSLAMPAEEVMALMLPKKRSAPLRYAVAELLCSVGSASIKDVCYFTGASRSTVRTMVKIGILEVSRREVLRRVAIDQVEPTPPPELNEEQQAAFQYLDSLCAQKAPAVALLYGVTGSGKTQVYIQLIRSVLARGRTAMVLVPEISLTPQFQRTFAAQFGDRIAVLHSSLRAGERYDEWKRIRSGKACVVLGTRSAVFAPLDNLGLIVIDEEQEASYQSENAPRYHARDVAKYRCAKNGALLLLGSATPSVETMYLAQTGVYQFATLRRRYNERALPDVCIADMKGELRNGNGSCIGTVLRRELKRNLERGEQSILFLNRRGASRMVSCGECGAVPVCPRCSVHLTYHSANNRLMCHYCGHSERLPQACPECGGSLNFIGVGTQRVQEDLKEIFPDVEVLRMDADTVSASQSHGALLAKFQNDRIPILVGTQMVAKGLDFENVTLVGVIAADFSLYTDSFRAGERTFSLLTQVVGRAGRGKKPGRAVIQTYTPDHEVIRCAAAQDYDGFYEQEIALRKLRGSPPFQDMMVLTASGVNETAVLRACQKIRRGLEISLRRPPYDRMDARLLGPAPAVVAKVNNRYRYRLTLCGKNNRVMRTLLAHVLCAAQTDRENRGVSVYVDRNPYN
ncbi:MAG: primosomal protein N' [Intestinimonas sp.]|jgi:primosomal protein N' (replication factor Y)|nr:primosomal protein N' [Intestinimonas sp.]